MRFAGFWWTKEFHDSRATRVYDQTYQNLHRFVPVAYSHVRGNLFVAADAKRAYGVASLREHWLLASELLKNFGCLGKAVAGFTDGDVQD